MQINLLQILEILMTAAGVFLLIKREVRFGPNSGLSGWHASAVALFLVLPLPLIYLTGVVLALLIGAGVADPSIIEVGGTLELGLVLGGLAGAVIFTLTFKSIEPHEPDEE